MAFHRLHRQGVVPRLHILCQCRAGGGVHGVILGAALAVRQRNGGFHPQKRATAGLRHIGFLVLRVVKDGQRGIDQLVQHDAHILLNDRHLGFDGRERRFRLRHIDLGFRHGSGGGGGSGGFCRLRSCNAGRHGAHAEARTEHASHAARQQFIKRQTHYGIAGKILHQFGCFEHSCLHKATEESPMYSFMIHDAVPDFNRRTAQIPVNIAVLPQKEERVSVLLRGGRHLWWPDPARTTTGCVGQNCAVCLGAELSRCGRAPPRCPGFAGAAGFTRGNPGAVLEPFPRQRDDSAQKIPLADAAHCVPQSPDRQGGRIGSKPFRVRKPDSGY